MRILGIAALVAVVGLAFGCHSKVTAFSQGGGGSDPAAGGTPGTGGSAAAGGTGVGGDAGGTGPMGGTGVGGDTGGTGGAGGSPCEVDCSQIVTDQCHEAICNEQTGQCAIVDLPAGTDCDDGLFCTLNEACSAGQCISGAPNTCGLTPAGCQQVICDEATQSCSIVPGGNGDPCTSPELCLENTVCQNGSCVGTPKDCSTSPVPGPCLVAVCNPQNGLCEPVAGNDGAFCQDPSDPCTYNKTCSGGVCAGGTPKNCSWWDDECVTGVCNQQTGQCEAVPMNAGDACPEAADDCNLGVCDAQGNCNPVPTYDGGPCEDGDPCTSGGFCAAGQCIGSQPIPQIDHWSEDFADNAAGWTLDTEWEIGPAQASSGQVWGSPDPAEDHTPTADNGIAGVAIGGTVDKTVHGFYYLTSPVVDVSGVTGALWLEYYRWLNSDYAPYMVNVVEVFDGVQWVELWKSGSAPGIQDDAWTYISHELTPYKNAALQVRFGFEVGSNGAFTVSGWNVDDVALVDVSCI